MSALGWGLSLGGGASVAGYVALLYFAPQAAIAIERIALDILKRILSTRIGCAALAALAFGIAGELHGDVRGSDRVQTEWDAAEQAAIVEDKEARAQAERQIPQLAPAESAPPGDVTPLTTPPAPQPGFHLPFFKPRAAHDCPPLPVPKCAVPSRARLLDPGVRNDPHNRDNH